MFTDRSRFGGNQEMLLHAEGFHFLLPATVVTVHTTEVLFGVPSKACVVGMNGYTLARTQDRRFVDQASKDWWALTMSGLSFMEMGQLEPSEWRATFPCGIGVAAREVLGARKRWGIVASPAATHLHPVSTFGARLAAFPEVFGADGMYFPHLEHALLENLRYLPQGDAKEAAHDRVQLLMDEVRSKILGDRNLTYQDYASWLMRRVMGSPGEGSVLTDTVSLFLASRVSKELHALLDLFLSRYAEMVNLYNRAISSDVCMSTIDASAGELPYVVHHPAESGDWWIKENVWVTPHEVKVGDRSIPYTGEMRTHADLHAVLHTVFSEFAVIPKAVCFLTQMLHVSSFVNPDECHYERLVKEFIRLMHGAGIEYSVHEATHGRWQQVMHALLAFGDQELMLPDEMAFAFKSDRLTGKELHRIHTDTDRQGLKQRLTLLLQLCASYESAQLPDCVLALLEAANYLPLGTADAYRAMNRACDERSRQTVPEKSDVVMRYERASRELFWRFIDGLQSGSKERSLVLRNLFFTGNLEALMVVSTEAAQLLEEANRLKKVNKADPMVDATLEELITLVREYQLMRLTKCPALAAARLTIKGGQSIFGCDVTPPEWFATLVRERELLTGCYEERITELEKSFRAFRQHTQAQMNALVEQGQLARAKMLKALHSLQLVDYYIGPVIGWVLGGDAYIQKIREQIHVVDHPVAPRL